MKGLQETPKSTWPSFQFAYLGCTMSLMTENLSNQLTKLLSKATSSQTTSQGIQRLLMMQCDKTTSPPANSIRTDPPFPFLVCSLFVWCWARSASGRDKLTVNERCILADKKCFIFLWNSRYIFSALRCTSLLHSALQVSQAFLR